MYHENVYISCIFIVGDILRNLYRVRGGTWHFEGQHAYLLTSSKSPVISELTGKSSKVKNEMYKIDV